MFASFRLSGASDVTEPPTRDRELLARILALDLLVGNPDRRHDHLLASADDGSLWRWSPPEAPAPAERNVAEVELASGLRLHRVLQTMAHPSWTGAER